jgi:hypothetical protein
MNRLSKRTMVNSRERKRTYIHETLKAFGMKKIKTRGLCHQSEGTGQ